MSSPKAVVTRGPLDDRFVKNFDKGLYNQQARKPSRGVFSELGEDKAMKIGFIGIGNIGAPIAGQLLKAGHELLVHDLRREAAADLLAAGAAWAASAADRPYFSRLSARRRESATFIWQPIVQML